MPFSVSGKNMYYAHGCGQLEANAEITHPRFGSWERTVSNSPVEVLSRCPLQFSLERKNQKQESCKASLRRVDMLNFSCP